MISMFDDWRMFVAWLRACRKNVVTFWKVMRLHDDAERDWWAIIRLLLTPWNWRYGAAYRKRIDHCRYNCPVFDHTLQRCRPYEDSVLGCGCHMPSKVRFGGGCWLTEQGEPGGWE